MLSVIISAQTESSLLARTLSSVVPAIPQGIVRDGWIIDTGSNSEIAAIADIAGCFHEKGAALELLPEIAQKCASDWLLILNAGVVLEEGWWREVAEFMEVYATGQDVNIVAARFVYANQQYGIRARITEWTAAMAAYVPLVARHKNALIARRQSIAGKAIQTFPPGIRGKSITLRAKAIIPG